MNSICFVICCIYLPPLAWVCQVFSVYLFRLWLAYLQFLQMSFYLLTAKERLTEFNFGLDLILPSSKIWSCILFSILWELRTASLCFFHWKISFKLLSIFFLDIVTWGFWGIFLISCFLFNSLRSLFLCSTAVTFLFRFFHSYLWVFS